jgi:sulfoxide reductase heme-binding subunit YedZ
MRVVLFRISVLAACVAPAAVLLYRMFVSRDLGINPVETLQHETGTRSLQLLLASLAITPLMRLTGGSPLIKVRRMLGVWAFIYAFAHFMTYLAFDRLFSFSGVIEDVALRRFILSGMVGLLAMLPLALTSTKGWIRRLGGKKWKKLHQLAYLAVVAGGLHFVWKEKVLTVETIGYSLTVIALLGFRLVEALRKRSRAQSRAPR